MKMIKAILVIIFCLISFNIFSEETAQTIKQPLFLICPHVEGSSSLSLYAIVDSKDTSKLLGVGLEELVGKNSKDNQYSDVQKAQVDSSVQKNTISELKLDSFPKGQLTYQDILKINVVIKDGIYSLDIDSKTSIDGHFQVGGIEKNSKNVIIEYGKLLKTWRLIANTFVDKEGTNIVKDNSKIITGLRIVASTTVVSRIVLIDEFGNGYVIYDK